MSPWYYHPGSNICHYVVARLDSTLESHFGAKQDRLDGTSRVALRTILFDSSALLPSI